LCTQFDHISNGRASWNVVTSTGEKKAHNFNFCTLDDHETRYERAKEFIEVMRERDFHDESHSSLKSTHRLASGPYPPPATIYQLTSSSCGPFQPIGRNQRRRDSPDEMTLLYPALQWN
jgi:alkanesulfonate monooxygenase SsuD/methylene tetrahydromethanopterin reductase-like flavin-dependent oxidoreductase (luciferase family)